MGGWERILTLTEWQNHKGMQRPLRILVVSEGYQNYQDGALSNQLTDVVRGRGVCMLGESEPVDLLLEYRGRSRSFSR